MSKTYYTLVFIKTEDKILLGYKKRGLGENTWNGYGGKLKDNEHIFNGAIRELYEESNLIASKEDMNYLGIVTYNDARTSLSHTRIVYIFTMNKVNGNPQETEEMKPEWFNLEEIPYDRMWPDSKFWLPLVLKDRCLEAEFTYKENCEIEKYEVRELKLPRLFSTDVYCTYGNCTNEELYNYDLPIRVKNN